MSNNVRFLEGTQENLNSLISSKGIQAGTFYATSDTQQLYYGLGSSSVKLLTEALASSNNTNKLFLVGATTQEEHPSTYSHNSVYMWDGSLYAKNLNMTGLLQGGAIDIHPESTSPTQISYFVNDLTGLRKRGGSCTATGITNWSNSMVDTIFDGTSSYAYLTLANASDTVVITIKSFQNFTYENKFGIGFGTTAWMPTNIKWEFGWASAIGGDPADSAWVTALNITNNTSPIVIGSGNGPTVGNASSKPWNTIRITMSGFSKTSPRIAGIWTMNYSSSSLATTLLPRVGGNIYGSLSVAESLTTNGTFKAGAFSTDNIATSSKLGVVKSATTGTTANRDYNVQILSDGTMKVNVPWTDANTWKANTKDQEGYVAAPAGVANKVWKTDSNGNPAWRDDSNTTYSAATNSAFGLIKLYNAARSGAITTQAASSTASRYYAIELDSNGKAFVNVPWTDTNTWKANTKDQEGYVAATAGVANKVWKTDSSGNPAWRDDPAYFITTYSYSNGNWTANHTYAEQEAVYNSGKILIASINHPDIESFYMPLSSFKSNLKYYGISQSNVLLLGKIIRSYTITHTRSDVITFTEEHPFNPLWVNYTENANGEIVADQSIYVIAEAYEEGRNVMALIETPDLVASLPLVAVADNCAYYATTLVYDNQIEFVDLSHDLSEIIYTHELINCAAYSKTKIYMTETEPTGAAVGDLWIDLSAGNEPIAYAEEAEF